MRTPRAIASGLMVCIAAVCAGQSTTKRDAILGVWKADEKVLSINIYKSDGEYKAKIISFTDHHSDIPTDQRADEHNPDESLRSRKMIGLDVLSGLTYNESDDTWQDGSIYDAASGKTYDATVTLSDGKLSVRAYKGISLLGKTLHFHR